MGISAPATTSSDTLECEDLEPPAQSYEGFGKKLRAGIRKVALVGQNLSRHQEVLGFKGSDVTARRRNP